MSLHPVLVDKLNVALSPAPVVPSTRRDARLPDVPGKVHAVIGMRRTGKTTFLRQLRDEAHLTLPPERAVYVSFDDDRLGDLDAAQLDALLEEYYRRYPELRGRETTHWYLDEIQVARGWDRFVRRVLDTERAEVVVSGSSAQMLSKEIHTALRGRGLATPIGPFGFREFLRHRGEEPEREAIRWTPAERSRVEKRFREYLTQGGFPEVQDLAPGLRTEVLQGYVDAVLFRDIVERYGVTQVAALRWLIRQCLRNPGGSFSVNRLYHDLRSQGHAIAKDTLHTLLAHLEDAFLVASVPLATESERQRQSNPRKLYPADPGLVHAFDPSGRANVGRALETVVQSELARRRADFGYARTPGGFEVDFSVRYPAGETELLQVCADPSGETARAREVRALADAKGTGYSPDRTLLLVLTRDQSLPFVGTDLVAQPVYEWLLEPLGSQ